MRVFATLILIFMMTAPVFAATDPARQAAELRDTQSPAEGPWNVYDRNGNLIRQENYSAYRLSGEARGFYPTGGLKETLYYTDGIRNGATKTYYENGVLQSESTYVNNNLSGLSKHYYDTGELESVSNYVDGNLDGQKKVYFKSGAVNKDLNYSNGVLNGGVLTYDLSGKIISEEKYTNGALIGRRDYTKDDLVSPAVSSASKPISPQVKTQPIKK